MKPAAGTDAMRIAYILSGAAAVVAAVIPDIRAPVAVVLGVAIAVLAVRDRKGEPFLLALAAVGFASASFFEVPNILDETLPVWGLAFVVSAAVLAVSSGRGFVAGPVAVCAVLLLPLAMNWSNWTYTLRQQSSFIPPGAFRLQDCEYALEGFFWPDNSRRHFVARCSNTSYLIVADAKDRTHARLNVSQWAWAKLGGENLECHMQWLDGKGLYTVCELDNGTYGQIGNQFVPGFPESGPVLDNVNLVAGSRAELAAAARNGVEPTSAARHLLHNEWAGNLDYHCAVFVKVVDNQLNVWGPVTADNAFGTRHDHGRLRSTVGAYHPLERCPYKFHTNRSAAVELWQAHRQHLTGPQLVAALDRWLADHAEAASRSFGLWSHGGGSFKWGIFYNTWFANTLFPEEFVPTRTTTRGTIVVPDTFGAAVDDFRTWLHRRGNWAAHIPPRSQPAPLGRAPPQALLLVGLVLLLPICALRTRKASWTIEFYLEQDAI